MQRHELDIRDQLLMRDDSAGRVITINSIQTFFTPLAEGLLNAKQGVLGSVMPVTACIGAAAAAQRRFLAKRFHVERILTTHDPRRIAFSENTGIHECLLICRRHSREDRPPTEFISLRRMPASAEEAVEIAEAIAAGQGRDWGQTCIWPAERVKAGDWTPVQWYDGELARNREGVGGTQRPSASRLSPEDRSDPTSRTRLVEAGHGWGTSSTSLGVRQRLRQIQALDARCPGAASRAWRQTSAPPRERLGK